MPTVSEKTIGRLSLYRRLLHDLVLEGEHSVYSHQLAALSGGTAAQVRRDLMVVGYSGSPNRGYDIQQLNKSIGNFLDSTEGEAAALVGVGNLGRAILAYFFGRRPKLTIQAAFDRDPEKTNRVIQGCRCYPLTDLREIVELKQIQIGVLTVPADQAQEVADQLILAGVHGIVNFAPLRLRVPNHVYVENIDMTMTLEKVAYFARQSVLRKDCAI